MAERTCESVRERLTDAFLSRHHSTEAEDAAHARGCAACGAVQAELRALGEGLQRLPAPELAADRALVLGRRAGDELRGSLPPGYRRALARLIGWAALPLPGLVLWYSELYRVGGVWLGEWLPPLVVSAIGVAYALATASWLALIYGSLPIVAHGVASRRWENRR